MDECKAVTRLMSWLTVIESISLIRKNIPAARSMILYIFFNVQSSSFWSQIITRLSQEFTILLNGEAVNDYFYLNFCTTHPLNYYFKNLFILSLYCYVRLSIVLWAFIIDIIVYLSFLSFLSFPYWSCRFFKILSFCMFFCFIY